MASSHITPSGGLLTHTFVEAVQQPSFNHPAATPETFKLPGRKAPSPAELDRTIGAAWELLVERWDAVEPEMVMLDISGLRERWIRPLFTLLDFNLEYQRADLVLEDDLRFPISHLGTPQGEPGAQVPIHTLLPSPTGLDARREMGSGMRRLSPHDMLQRYLNLKPDTIWGLVCDGLRLRLLRDYHHTYTRGYVEFDLQGIFSERDVSAFRALYRLCHASRFLPMAAPAPVQSKGKTAKKEVLDEETGEEAEPEAEEQPALIPLESFYQHALSTGVRVGDDLRQNVRLAIETFANGFLQATPGLLSRIEGPGQSPAALYQDILHTIYRILFLLFAEQRGMFPARGSLYMDEFSLTALRLLAERPAVDDPHIDLWEKLKTTFRMVEQGAPSLGVFAYNGALFSPGRTPLLTPEAGGPALRNDALLSAVRALTTVERDGVLQRISYADLSVEEIGSVYESLLDYTPRIATTHITIERRPVQPGMFFLDPAGKERKTTGSYYTHPSLVNELIRSALLPVLEDRLAQAVPGYDPDHPERLDQAQRQAAEAALLNLKVIDPAAGSGAFLIAADNAMGLRLAQIRSGDLYPPERQVRLSRRDVLARCLYAVDLNPLAVELCKVSLWINAVVEDQPLNFLDHHIKCGNSLVGGMRNLVERGIPSEAYGGATGDDRELTRAVKGRNDQERAGQRSSFHVTELKSMDDLRAWSELSKEAQEHPALAEQRYREMWSQSDESPERLAFDLWTAAFFWPLPAAEQHSDRQRQQTGIQARPGERRIPAPPTTQDVFQALADPKLVPKELKDWAKRMSQEQRFFHWELEFPDVFTGKRTARGQRRDNFDVVLGNPPWERIKLQEKEFFAVHDAQIAAAPNADARRRMIKALPGANPALAEIYRQALCSSENLSKFLRSSGRYPLTSGGDINTYSVFSDLAHELIGMDNGRAGIIVPSGIATDFTNKEFFASLVEKGQIASLYDFENRRKLFSQVDSRMKFSLLTICSPDPDKISPGTQENIKIGDFAFFLYSTDDLNDPERRFNLTYEDFKLLNPNTRTCPIFRSRRDADLTRKMYQAAPILVNEATGENPWGVSFLRMFDMTNDSGLFRTRQQLEDDGFSLIGNRFVKGDDVRLPLYEAKMINHYDPHYATFAHQETIRNSTLNEHMDPSYLVWPRYWVSKDETGKRTSSRYDWLIAFRGIARVTDVRTSIFTIIPNTGTGNSLPIFCFRREGITAAHSTALLGNLCSLTFDFCVRQKLGGINFNFFILEQLPVLTPNEYNTRLFEYLVPKVCELLWTGFDLSSLYLLTGDWESRHADQGLKCVEGIDTFQRRGINDRSQSSKGVSAPLRSETARDLAVNHGRSQSPLADIIGWRDIGTVEKDE